ncbi:hypothetical protein RA086_12915 [Lactiplantibacillus sp. WILCCON 0030]|uniref:Uncharacterized protein n=1 Tax=Lactiplantibacillus brownii TaxID=3069269 RepID=A0ABU1ADQ0_9LACO|nr:hypothetical protein [Lactiplantibacillus brownii]MDQ7938508.1 hypothetical protein [Lactiplantibacillus brownii]
MNRPVLLHRQQQAGSFTLPSTAPTPVPAEPMPVKAHWQPSVRVGRFKPVPNS